MNLSRFRVIFLAVVMGVVFVAQPSYAQEASGQETPAAVTSMPTTQPASQTTGADALDAATTQPTAVSQDAATTQPDDEAAVPATQPATTDGTSPDETKPRVLPDGQIMFNFQNASLQSVLIYFSEVAGLTIINDAKVTGRVNVFNRKPMTIHEALEVLNSVLKDRNYAAVRQGKTLRILPLEDAKKATIPVFTGSDPSKIAQTDDMITQVIPVRYADAAKLKTDLAALVPSYADLSSNVSTNTLILTDTSANVRKIVEIIQALDTSVSSVTSVRVFALQYANASSAAKLITEVFKPDSTNQNGRNARTARFFRGRRTAANAAPEEGSKPETRVVASSDDRTNTVVVSAPQDMMPLITQVLSDLDANPAQDQAVFVYYLRNADSVNVQNVINSLFNTTGSGGRTAGAGSNANTQRGSSFNSGFGTRGNTRSTGSGNSNLGLSNIGTRSAATTNRSSTTRAATTTAPSRAAAGRTGAAGNARLSKAANQTATDLSGQVFAVADQDTNSVLVMTATSNFDSVKQILQELDRPVPQVLIKVLMAEVTHSNSADLGVEFSAINLKTSGATTLFSDFGVASATPGGLLFKLVEPDISVAIAALQKVGKLDVLSRPYILTSDNQTASIIVGQRVPFINNSRITDTGQTINTITYEDIGIILNVTPHINPDGLVVMDVAPEISSVTGDSVPISDNASAPVFAKRSAQTRVAINNGQTIVIGGMMQDQKTKTVHKIPLLGDIPLIGALFRRDQTDISKTELLIFITPHVADEPDKLKPLTKEDLDRTKLLPDAVSPGVFDEHLRNMQREGAEPLRPNATQPTYKDPATPFYVPQ